MLKRSLLLGLLLFVLVLPGLVVPCAAQDGNSEADIYAEFQNCLAVLQNTSEEADSIVSTRGATDYYHYMVIPYNIVAPHWITGLNYNCVKGEKLLVGYVHNGETYRAIYVDFTGKTDITRVVSDKFFMGDEPFRSPTKLVIFSTKGSFTVTQFLMYDIGGFGFQTFYSGTGK
jgi:hypothetical protein